MRESISPRLKAKHYRQVLKYVQSHEITGLCYAITETAQLHRWNSHTLASMLVDLRKNKPKVLLTRNAFHYYPYWWEAGNKKQRIEFLVKLIAQNEQKSAVNMMTIMAFCAVTAACLIGILAVCLL
jgi:hypothetical protein